MARKQKRKAEPAKIDGQETVAVTIDLPETVETDVDTIKDTDLLAMQLASIAEQDKQAEAQPVAEPVKAEAPSLVPLISIEQAAASFIVGMNDNWLSSIKVRAQMMGYPINGVQTPDTWKKVFRAWGGNSIIKA